LKFFNKRGEFIDKKALDEICSLYDSGEFISASYKKLGGLKNDNSWIDKHVAQIVNLKVIDHRRLKKRKLRAVVDAVNGAGSIALPQLLNKLGVDVVRLNCDNDGNFVHNPEPAPKNLEMLAAAVKKFKADIGLACDPDADRLALVDEGGNAISEEFTLALAVKYILSKTNGKVVVNLSTSKATESVAKEFGARTYYSAVGEANVITEMRKQRAVIGGEGNGGVIYPALHYGRDSLVGAAIICSLLAKSGKTLSELVGTLPIYYNIKLKASLPSGYEFKVSRMEKVAIKSFDNLKIDRRDGLRFDFAQGWFQIRKSNTEPIYRLIIETVDERLTKMIKREVMSFLR
jgi:phosphomannomutase